MMISENMGKVWKLVVAALLLLSSSAYAQQIVSAKYYKNNPDGSQTLLNHMPLAVAQGLAIKTAHANSSQMLDLRITLPSKDQAGLDQFISELYNIKSPNYHKFLTPAQFALLYGASSTDSAIVIQYLKSHGFVVKSQSNNGFILTVTGQVSVVEPAFKVNINNYKNTDGTTFFAPDANPTIPPQVAGKIDAVVGMDNEIKFYPHYYATKNTGAVKTQVPKTAVNPQAKAISPAFSGPGNTLEPNDIITAYNLTSLSSTTGSGQTLGLYELDGYLASDIATYRSSFSLPNVTLSNIYTDGATGTPGTNTGEVVLDIDLAIAVAPGLSNIIVYEAPDDGADWLDQWNTIANADAAKVISVSWGGYEALYGNYDHTVFSQLAAQGQSVFASAGDSGAYDNCANSNNPPPCSGGVISVDDPASDPYITGVGISVLTTNGNGTYNSETASLYGGGGISSVWSIPTYQQGLTLAAGSMVSTTMRNVPDVVLTADPATSYYIYITNGSITGGGTATGWFDVWGSSAASPIWAAFMSRVNQGRVTAGQTVIGYLNPVIYPLFTQNGSICSSNSSLCDFHDITTGTNSYYPAKPGYDDATGLGSFNGVNLYEDLVVPAAPTDLTAVPGDATVVLNWTASAGAVSYNVQRSTVSGSSYTTISTSGQVTGTTYTDNTAMNSQTYYYVVNAVDLLGQAGPNSAQVSATPLAPPLAPASVTAVPGNTQVGLSWAASATAASYNVNRSTTSGGSYSLVTTVPGLSYTDSGLTNAQPYYYVITATNVGGTSGNSPQATATPLASLPIAPTGLNALAGNAKVSLTWNASATATSYNVKRATAAGGSYTTISTSGQVTGTAYTDSTAANGTTYYYVVSAVNGSGQGANSTEVNATPIALAGPTNLNAAILAARVGKTIIEGGVTLTWKQTIAPGVIQNKIYRSTGSGPNTLLTTISASTTYTDKNLTKGTTYHYEVTAYFSSSTESSPSNLVTVNY